MNIFSISDHDGIRFSRELLLRSVGYHVISATSESVQIGEMPDDVQLVIIGQTVQGRAASRLISAVRKLRPNVQIMRITTHLEQAETECDSSCFVEDGPATFLLCVSTLLSNDRPKYGPDSNVDGPDSNVVILKID